MTLNWIVVSIIVGVVILGIIFSFPIISENERIANQMDKKNKLQDLSKKGVITYNSSGIGENIADYRFGVNDISFTIDPTLEKNLREKQRLFTDNITKPLYSDNNLDIPANHVTINKEWKALEVGIEPDFLTDENISKYFAGIRKIVGEQVNIVLVPSYPATPTDN